MLPPWSKFPEIPRSSIGWRMGVGEDHWTNFCSWFKSLSERERHAYESSNPEPPEWQGFYLQIISPVTGPDPDDRSEVGWYVRVTTADIRNGNAVTKLYIAGYPTPREAEDAVRRCRGAPGEQYQTLAGEIVPGIGPQPQPLEIRELRGAI